MVYVTRTRIHLSDEELELLERASRASGASRSELVRRAVRAMFGGGDGAQRVAALQEASGIWRDRPFTGTEYVDAVRGDLDERLRRLGVAE